MSRGGVGAAGAHVWCEVGRNAAVVIYSAGVLLPRERRGEESRNISPPHLDVKRTPVSGSEQRRGSGTFQSGTAEGS